MSDFTFTKAKKGLKPLRMVIGGPSGSGKSKTALIFANYLKSLTGKPTAAIDTEHGRLSLYADEFDFQVIEAEPPFNPEILVKMIHAAEDAGFGQLVIDSSSHYYIGTGGLLEIVQEVSKQKFGGNQYAGWSYGTPLHNKLVDTIIRSPMHIIITSRSKQKYVEEENNGKKNYKKVGEEMQQRDGLEYEFDFCLMMDMEHTASVSKGLNKIDTTVYFKKPDESTIKLIMEELQKDTDPTSEKTFARKENIEDIFEEMKSIVKANPELKEKLREAGKKYEPSGNFKLIKSVEDAKSLRDEFKNIVKGE